MWFPNQHSVLSTVGVGHPHSSLGVSAGLLMSACHQLQSPDQVTLIRVTRSQVQNLALTFVRVKEVGGGSAL